MHKPLVLALAVGAAMAWTASHSAESQCFGTVAKGRLEKGVKLPSSGQNFSAYSSLGTVAGRTFVHSKVAEVVVAAYDALAKGKPEVSGGRFRPHRSHQNGLSVDFFVPVTDPNGKFVSLPIGVTNKLGYDLEFDAEARLGELRIDFDAIAEHLYQLHVAARARGVGISMVILDPQYHSKLLSSSRGTYIRQNIPFMKGKPWVRHDEHYHVDFAVRCAPNAG
ncbi:MAG: replication initiation protein [Comamonadaceae bacterium]|nr:MAG: replication initiation protein [Comamonadaceae bacterium]